MSPDKDIFTKLLHYITPAFHGSCFKISLDRLVFPFLLYWTSEADTPRLDAPVRVFVLASTRVLALHHTCSVSVFKMSFSSLYCDLLQLDVFGKVP